MKTIAVIFGLIMLAVGALGFVPQATPEGYLLGIFHINLEHNLVHLLTGAISLICGLTSFNAARTFFQIFGIVYGIVAVLGFYYGNAPIFGILANNMADTWLHVAIAAVSLWLGFGCCCGPCDTSYTPPSDEHKP